MFSLNFVSVPIVGDIINFYPLLNLITSAIQLITLKNNILQIYLSFNPKSTFSLETDNVLKLI